IRISARNKVHTMATVEGRHRFRVAGYGATKGAAPGHRVASGTFTVGGFDWAVVFYPEGVTAADMDFVSVYLELKNAAAAAGGGGGGAVARAFYDLRLIHPATGEPRSVRWPMDGSTSRVFSQAFPAWGHLRFMRRRELEEMGFVRDDRLTIECVVNVVLDPVVTAGDAPELDHPPSNILGHLAGLLGDKGTADVTLVVRGEEFAAHRAVLAMRSPVFKAALYGPMKKSTDANAGRVAIDGVEPAVFRALLHFIYTDTTAAMDDLDDDDDKAQMIMHLLEAADRYDVERLKLICELMLCKSIAVDTVAATLAMADQHHCQKLKEACIEFLATSKKMEGIMESQGYEKMKLSCPSFMVDLWEIIGRKMTSYSVIPNIYARDKD
uniref:BTB domain-containing protein n=2 Tax=Oryza glaberrima TaxID=4538 RepID=I1QFC1_ORYGL